MAADLHCTGTATGGEAGAVVEDDAMRAGSHVMVDFTANPGGAAVAWIERDHAKFTIHLTAGVGNDTSFIYFIVEPA